MDKDLLPGRIFHRPAIEVGLVSTKQSSSLCCENQKEMPLYRISRECIVVDVPPYCTDKVIAHTLQYI
jgi:hypothetical protein